MRPPPKSDVLLMSSGTAPRAPGRFGLRNVLNALETMPPAPNQREVLRFTNPPNEDAYGEGNRKQSIAKSHAKPRRPLATKRRHPALALMSFRASWVANPRPTPIPIAVSW